MSARKKSIGEEPKPFRKGITREAREAQMIDLAFDAVETRIREGHASAMELTHFLKLGSIRAEAELEELRARGKLAVAKTENLEGQKDIIKLYEEALTAFRSYNGHQEEEDFDEDL